MSKKGISPLIGTVLLVAIVIAMILLIMPWITKTIKTQQEKTTEATKQFECLDLNFELGKEAITNNIIVNNRGSVDIVKLDFRQYALDGSLSATTPDATLLAAYDQRTTSIACNSATLNRVEVVATIKVGNDDLTCADAYREIFC